MSLQSAYPLALIAAVAANGTIGRAGDMPWHLPLDLRYFKEMTMGRRLVMGARTWESLPGRLPGREHVVVSHRDLALPSGVVLATSLRQALELPLTEQQQALPGAPVFVIGGGQIYAQALPLASDLYLTEIDAHIDGDTVFPNWNCAEFVELNRETHTGALAPGDAEVSFAFVHYRRRQPRLSTAPNQHLSFEAGE